MKNINVPVGISNFEKIWQDGYYYVDTVKDAILSLPFFFTFFSIAKKKSSHKMKTPLNTRLIIP